MRTDRCNRAAISRLELPCTASAALQNAYAKLGVSRRNDLAAVLAGGGVPEPADELP